MPRSRLAVPEHPELPPEARQAYVEVDRKLGVFILPQLSELHQDRAVAALLDQGAELAGRAAAGEHEGLGAAYQELLAGAQAALRQARREEVEAGRRDGDRRHDRAELGDAMQSARTRLPVRRMAQLEARLTKLEGEADSAPSRRLLIAEAIEEWERLSQARQAREAQRLADTAHIPVRPKHRETSRSRRALREQAQIAELARKFSPEAGRSRRQGAPADGPSVAEGL